LFFEIIKVFVLHFSEKNFFDIVRKKGRDRIHKTS